jgi:hypothetical protein
MACHLWTGVERFHSSIWSDSEFQILRQECWHRLSSSTFRAEKAFLYDSIDDTDTTESELHCLEVLGENMVWACTDIG